MILPISLPEIKCKHEEYQVVQFIRYKIEKQFQEVGRRNEVFIIDPLAIVGYYRL